MTQPATALTNRIRRAQEARKPDWPIYGKQDEQLDRTQFLTSSENTACLRRLFLEKKFPDLVEQSWGFAQRGHAVEAWVVDRLEESLLPEEQLRFSGWAQRSFIDEKCRLSGTPDGLLYAVGERPVLVEIKSVDPRTNWDNLTEPKPQHYAQVQQNMYLLRHNMASLRRIDMRYARLIYQDASNFEQSVEFMVPWSPVAVDTYIARANQLFSAEHAHELPAEGLTSADGCTYCSFKEGCSTIETKAGRERKERVPKNPPKFAPRNISAKLTKYGTLQEEIKTKSAKLKEIGAELKAHAEAEDSTLIENKTYTAEMQSVAGRKTFDHKAFGAENPLVDLDPYWKVGKPSVRLTVKKRETE